MALPFLSKINELRQETEELEKITSKVKEIHAIMLSRPDAENGRNTTLSRLGIFELQSDFFDVQISITYVNLYDAFIHKRSIFQSTAKSLVNSTGHSLKSPWSSRNDLSVS